MTKSRLDAIYRRLLITRFFEKGWGTPENLQRLFEFRKIVSDREKCVKLISPDYPVEITKDEKTSDCRIFEGKFLSPFEIHLPGLLPKVAQEAHFQVILPLKWNNDKYKPMCIHLAGTGDHYYWRRRNFIAKPLLREAGIGAIILENPFYGVRKPKEQVRSCLHNVSDIFVMGGCLVLESLVLLNWCEKNGLGPLGITGISMGGHMASLAATNWPKPIVLVPCLSWSTASSVFTQGVMSRSINWDYLESQFFADGNYYERLAKMVAVVDESFLAGKQFIEKFNQSMEDLKCDINEVQYKTESAINIKQVADSNELLENQVSKDVIKLTIKLNKFSNKIVKQDKLRSTDDRNIIITATNGINSAIFAGRSKLMNLILPITKQISTKKSSVKNEKIDITKINWWERETLHFMRGVMDECTHLKNFSVPFDTSLIIAVCAKDDAYVPREGCTSLEEVWPGAEVRYLDAGHVSAYVLHQKLFRSCIIEAFERSKQKWNPQLNNYITKKIEIVHFKLKDTF